MGTTGRKRKKIQKHSVLDNTALFLFIVLIAENTILFATRIFFQEEMYAKAMPFLWNCLYLFWVQAFFGIQIYLPLAHNN